MDEHYKMHLKKKKRPTGGSQWVGPNYAIVKTELLENEFEFEEFRKRKQPTACN